MALNADQDVVVKFGADATGLQQGTATAAQAVEAATGKMNGAFGQLKDIISGQSQSVVSSFGAVGDAIGKLGGAFASVGALLAGGTVFNAAIQAASNEGAEVKKLMNSLGMTSEAASKMKIALELVGMSAQEYVGIAMKFDRQLKSNEEGLKALGVVTRDHNGSLLSQEKLLQNATETMMTYKAGTERNAFAITAFGRSADEAFKLLKLDENVKKRADELAVSLGEIVTDKDLSDIKGYKIEMAAVGVVVGSFAENLGAAVIPALTELAKAFMEIAITVMPAIKSAFDIFGTAFTELGRLVHGVIGQILYGFETLTDRSSKTFRQDMPDDLHGWALAMKNTYAIFAEFTTGVLNGFALVIAGADHIGVALQGLARYTANENIRKAVLQGDFSGFEKSAAETKARHDSITSDLIATFNRNDKALNGRLSEIDASFKATTPKGTTGYREYVDPKSGGKGSGESGSPSGSDSAGEAEAKRLAAEAEKLAYDTQRAEIEGERSVAKSVIEIEKEKLDQKLALREINTEEFLRQTKTLEDRRYELEKSALAERLELDKKDPKNAAKLKSDYAALEVLENAHIAKSIASQTKMIEEKRKEWNSLFTSISSGMGKAIGGFIVGTQSLGTALKGIYTSIQQAFATMIGDMISKWVAGELAKLGISQAVNSALVALGLATSATTVATKTVETGVVVPLEAAQAASGAAASVAPTPFIGPVLAAAAFAAIMAMVMGSMHSASGGFDIPAGVNPMTQLHAKEMVLPAQYADVIRGMAGNGGSKGVSQGGDVHLHVSAVDALSVRRLFHENGAALADSLKHQMRNLKR